MTPELPTEEIASIATPLLSPRNALITTLVAAIGYSALQSIELPTSPLRNPSTILLQTRMIPELRANEADVDKMIEDSDKRMANLKAKIWPKLEEMALGTDQEYALASQLATP